MLQTAVRVLPCDVLVRGLLLHEARNAGVLKAEHSQREFERREEHDVHDDTHDGVPEFPSADARRQHEATTPKSETLPIESFEHGVELEHAALAALEYPRGAYALLQREAPILRLVAELRSLRVPSLELGL